MRNSSYVPGVTTNEIHNAEVAVVSGQTTLATITTGAASGTAGAATSATSLAKPTGAADWTASDLVGKWLEVTGGGGYDANVPVLRPILSNTTTTAAVNEVVGMDATTTFEFVTLESFTSLVQGYDVRNAPGALEVYGISFDASADSLVALTDCANITLSGCAFTANTAAASVLATRVGWLRLEHCLLTGGADVEVSDCLNVELHGLVSDAGGAISVANAMTCAVTKLSAVDAPSSVLRLTKVHSATAEVAASDGGATPVYLEDVANFSVVGGTLTGTGNTGYGVEITGSGSYLLTGSTIAGATGDVLFFGRAVTWALLSGTDYGIVEEHAAHARARASYTKAIKYGNYLFDGSIDVSGRLLLYGYLNQSAPLGAITATGTNQATALQLGAVAFAEVTTTPSGTGVILPPNAAIAGCECTILNSGAYELKVYPPGAGTIDGRAVVTLQPGCSRRFFSRNATSGLSWWSAGRDQLDSGTWRDLEGDVSLKTGGAGQPTLDELFVGSTFQVPFFAVNDVASFAFHMPHDWVRGSDLYLHVHWTHNGAAISGSLVNSFEVSYCKGHNQEAFPAPFTVVQTIPSPDIATVPRYRHRIDEFQLSASSPTATQLDSDALEVDGLILCSIKTTTIPTITGGTPNAPAILFVDIHYLSSNQGTINKAPNFYGAT